MQQEIFKDLEKIGHKFSKIETELEMPKNYLSRFKNPENKLPEKWFAPLQKYIARHLPNEAAKKSEYPLEGKDMIPKTKLVVEKSGLKERPSNAQMDAARESMAKINKDFGEGTVMFFGDRPNQKVETISTGSIGLDAALGIGGLPRGRIVEIYGLESSGKTTIALQVIANAQKEGLKCLLVDAENSFDPEYAENLGVIVEDLAYCQPSCGEDGLEVADRQISDKKVNVVVIDSVAAMIPKRELEGEMGDSVMGLHARLMSQACRKMVGSVAKTNTLLIFINQLRNKIGIAYGNPEVTTGGLALQFYASVRLSVTKMAKIVDGEVQVGNRTKIKVTKNKCSPPFKSAEFDIIYGQGVDKTGELVDIGSELGVITKSGSWFSYGTDKLGQGRDGVKTLLNDNPDMADEIEGKIREKMG